MKTRHLLAAVLLCLTVNAKAQSLSITAAADLKFCLDKVVDSYKKEHPKADIQVGYGSSGKAFAQLQQGAPFDLFFSADIEYPRKLVEAGLAEGKPQLYAIGRIVLWSATEDASRLTLKDLANPRFAKVAIANPEHAPYGKRAQEALTRSKVWDALQPRLVLGENIAQTAQYVQSGAAPIGILALSLVKSPAFEGKPYLLIPDSLHAPLEQACVRMKRAKDNALAGDFLDYLKSPKARKLFVDYGFVLPGEK